jgi:hypothetical protein
MTADDDVTAGRGAAQSATRPNPAGKVPTTRALNFRPANPQQDLLFAVRAGVPVIDALQMAQCLLEASIEVGGDCAENGGMGACGAVYLAEFAKALLDSSVEGIAAGVHHG